MSNTDEQLRARLQTIVDGSTQAEVARKTGTSMANVNRYLKGTRMPASFCTALVEGLNINPAWLLSGEGMPKIEDVTAGTAKMAGDILELVEAMNAVTQMRLGALTGRHHQKVLRELNDALIRMDTLRERLDEYSSDIFRKLLDDLGDALARMNLDRARDIQKAAAQVSRLSTDPAMQRDYIRKSTHIAYLSNEHEANLGLLRKVFFQALMGDDLTEDEAQDAGRYALTLAQLNRRAEAERYTRAIIVLLDDKDWPVLYWTRFSLAILMLDQGRVAEALPIMQENIGHITGVRRAGAQANIGQAMLMLGVFSVPEAIAFGENVKAKATSILHFTAWTENVADLKAALKFAKTPSLKWRSGEKERILAFPTLLLKALTGGSVKVAEINALAPSSDDVRNNLSYLIRKTQILRLQGNIAPARKACAKVGKLLADNPLLIITTATHYKNARLLGVDKASTDEWFSRHSWCKKATT